MCNICAFYKHLDLEFTKPGVISLLKYSLNINKLSTEYLYPFPKEQWMEKFNTLQKENRKNFSTCHRA